MAGAPGGRLDIFDLAIKMFVISSVVTAIILATSMIATWSSELARATMAVLAAIVTLKLLPSSGHTWLLAKVDSGLHGLFGWTSLPAQYQSVGVLGDARGAGANSAETTLAC